MKQNEKVFDIRVRALKFAVTIVRLAQKLKKNHHYEMASQIIRSGTSIGANLAESKSAQSRKEFISKLNIALGEARETYYWLEVLDELKVISDEEMTGLRQETEEIIKILVVMVKNTLRN